MTLLKAVGNDPDTAQDYAYLVTMASAYQQQHDNARALTTFARANDIMAGNDYARDTEMRLAEEQGRQVTEQVSAGPELMVHPIF